MIPNDIEAEKTILGTILVENDLLPIAKSIIKPNAFYLPEHQHIFTAMSELENIDAITLGDHLKNNDLLDIVGGYKELSRLDTFAGPSCNMGEWCRIVLEKYHLRLLIELSLSITKKTKTHDAKSNNIIDETIERLLEIKESLGVNSNISSVTENIKEIVSEVELVSKGKHDTGLFTGYTDIDDQHGGGIQKNDLIFLAAKPSTGKTSLSICLSIGLIQRNKRGIFFSIESSKKSIIRDRLLPIMLEIDSYKIRSGKLSQDEWDKIYSIEKRILDKLKICDMSKITVDDIYSMVSMEHRQKGVDFIVIDYIQLIDIPKTSGSRNDDLGEIAKGLKRINKDFDIPVIALSQVNEQGRLRNSGELENAADVKILMEKTESYENTGLIELSYQKNRNGRIGNLPYVFIPEFTKFKQVT